MSFVSFYNVEHSYKIGMVVPIYPWENTSNNRSFDSFRISSGPWSYHSEHKSVYTEGKHLLRTQGIP